MTSTTTQDQATVTPITQAKARRPRNKTARGTQLAAKTGNPVQDRALNSEALTQEGTTTMTDQTPTTTQDQPSTPQVVAVTDSAGNPAPVRATWKQHGNPASGFQFYGTAIKAPAEQGIPVAKVVTDPQGITLKSANGRAIKGGSFGAATKFWAVVPEGAPAYQAPAKASSTTPKVTDPAAEAAKAKARAEAAERAKARAAKSAARTANIPAEVLALVPEGYSLLWPKGVFGLCKRTGAEALAVDSPAWLTLCYAHGTTHPAANARQAEAAGAQAERVTWCKQCKADKAKADKAQAKADKAPKDQATPEAAPEGTQEPTTDQPAAE